MRDRRNVETILVTGGLGFMGSNFVRWVIERHSDVRVLVLDNLTYAANPENLAGISETQVEVVIGDVCNKSVVNYFMSRSDACVHFAAESHNDRSIWDPESFLRTNVGGTFTLLEAARYYDVRFHYVSTDEVYGDLTLNDPVRFTEDFPYCPSSPYSSTKASGDMLVKAWARTYGLNATVSNSSNNYGPRQHVEKFIPRQITNIIRGMRPRIYGAGNNVRDWVYVDDHSSAVWEILTHGVAGESYLIGAGNERSNIDVVRTILSVMGEDSNAFDCVADRPGHDLRYAVDPSKLRDKLGWNPVYVDFLEGIRATVSWYRENENWWAGSKDLVEREYSSINM